MRLELTRESLLVQLANPYTTNKAAGLRPGAVFKVKDRFDAERLTASAVPTLGG